ncbi:protein phosphatase 1 regulatory inhibitor subunit 16B [Sinocyclocheilus rhinocerous]|uniref:protein phosphatase 1 regulatory inhibitor subunit 16B n=1 Tax=Sinocyclocheilus rhinocerous TaxID=307959 RepID=UPI0007B94936|nr:PREDICTED: protein phosphatase 1 regulatory inhibitor subunit 16B-like [Sinocyclocheilus rhinocerous]
MASHLELLTELQQLDKVPSLERLRAAQKRRTQQLKRWAVYEKEMQNKKRKADKRRGHGNLRENHRRVSFAASIALLEASARNDPDEDLQNDLHITAANGYAEAAEMLLEGGARTDMKDSDGWTPLHAAACWGQVHVAELLVSHGANLNAKTYMEETPIDLCEDEEFRNHLLELKHKHDIIMKSQLKHKTSLCRRTSSTGSRGKVVRRASLSDRHNLCRKEYQTEAIVWRGGREEEERERESDQENSHSTQPDDVPRALGILKDGGRQNGCISSTPASPTSNGDPVTPDPCDPEELKPKERAQTLSELKKQRAAAKLLSQPVLNGHLGNGSTKPSPEDPRMPLVSSNGSAVYFTPASGDPPLLRFKQPIEDELQTTQPDDVPRALGILKDGGRQNGCISSTPASPTSNGDPVTPDPCDPEELKPKERAQTLSELKKQRAAAKLLSQPVLNGHLGNGSNKSLI